MRGINKDNKQCLLKLDYRMIEPLELERTFKGPSLTPLQWTGTSTEIRLLRAWSSLNVSEDRASTNHLPGKPFPVSHHHCCRKLPLYLRKISPFFFFFLKFEAIPPCSVTTGPAKEPVPFPLTAPFYILKVCYQFPWSSLFSRLISPNSLRLFS